MGNFAENLDLGKRVLPPEDLNFFVHLFIALL